MFKARPTPSDGKLGSAFFCCIFIQIDSEIQSSMLFFFDIHLEFQSPRNCPCFSVGTLSALGVESSGSVPGHSTLSI